MKEFFTGVRYFFTGFQLIAKPGLRLFVVIPLLINILLFIGLFFVLRHFMGEFNAWFTSFLPTWLAWLSYLLWLFFMIGFFVVFVYTFVIIGNLVAAPFNSFLAEKVEVYLTGTPAANTTLWENIQDIPRIIGRQLAILGYFMPRAFILLIFFFIPVIQAIAAFLWFLFSAWNMALTYTDYPTDNHRIPVSEVQQWLQKKRSIAWGFGISVLLTSMIPGINLLTIPAAVAGATLFWVKENKLN